MSEKQTEGGGSGARIKKTSAAERGTAPVISSSQGGGAKPKPKPKSGSSSAADTSAGKNNIKINSGSGNASPEKKPSVKTSSVDKAKTAKKPSAAKDGGKPSKPAQRPKSDDILKDGDREKNTSKNREKVSAPAEPSRRAVHTDLGEIRRNERSIRILKRVMAALIVLLIGIIIYITYPKWIVKLEGLFDRPVRTDTGSSTEEGNFPLEPDNAVTGIFRVKNDLLTTDMHTLTFYDVNGERKASYSHNFSKPVVRTAGKRVLVFDSGAYGFKLYKKGGEIYSKTVDNTILTGSVCDSGTAVIVTTSNKYAASAKFYDKDGKLIYNYDSASKIMSATLTPDGSSCYITTFYSGDGELHSQIRRIDLAESGEKMISEEIPSLVLNCCVNDAGDIMAAGDTAFYILGSDGRLRSEYKYEGDLLSYDLDGAGAAVLLSGPSKNSGRLMIAQSGAAGSAEFRELTSETAIKLVKVIDSRVILLGSSKLYALDMTGTLTAATDIGREYGNLAYIEEGLYLLGKRGIDKIKFAM